MPIRPQGYGDPDVAVPRRRAGHRSGDDPASSADWIREIDQAGAVFGNYMASAGDVNGDGFHDVLVGASRFDGAFTDSGRITLFAGSLSGLSAAPSWSFDRAGAFLSRALGAGDVNGDAFHDVVVADPGYSDQLAGRGRHKGAAAGPETREARSVSVDLEGGEFIAVVGFAGNIDGDSFVDLAMSTLGTRHGI